MPSSVLPPRAFAAVSLLFAVSGATALAYEVIWLERFGQVWGNSSLAVAVVVACFLFGLGAGARAFGRVADRSVRPLRAYALCEAGIAVLALAVPVGARLLTPVSSALYGALSDQPLVFAVARFAVSLLVLGPPAILMGATLPLLVRQYSALGGPASATSWLYFLNSAGAALGAWMTGFFLLPELGLSGANALVVGVNLAVAGAAWWISARLAALPEPRPEEAPDAPARLSLAVLAAALLTGLAGISLQMVWTRQVVLIVGGSVYAFTAVVSVFILGIAAGSLAFRLVVREGDRVSMAWVIGGSVVSLVATVLLGHSLRPAVTRVVAELSPLRAIPSYNAVVCAGASAALQGLPTFFMGVLFPSLVRFSGADRAHAGRAVGRLYAWNTAGSIAGATATGAVLFPLIGTYGSTLAMLGVYVASAFLLFPPWRAAADRVGVTLAATALAGAVLGGALLRHPAETRMELNLGAYLYGNEVARSLSREAELLHFTTGSTSNVMVVAADPGGLPTAAGEDRAIAIRVNGKVDGGNGASDMQTQLGCAYLPRFLRPEATDVLVIGFGTGTTVGASLLFAGTRVDCCEIEPAVVAASEHFRGVNYVPLESPDYRTIVEDGRNYLQSTDRRYDLVVSVPSNPWIAGVGSLFTREYYESAKERLKPGGLLGQWIQSYQLDPADYALIANTVRSSFEHAALVRFNDADTMLVASDAPIVPPVAAIERSQDLVAADPRIGADLERYFGTSDVRAFLLLHLLLDDAGIARFVEATGQTAINTDDNLRLEFDAPHRVFQARSSERGEVVTALLGAASPEFHRELISHWGWTRSQARTLLFLRDVFMEHGHRELAARTSLLGLAFATDPPPEFLVDRIVHAPSGEDEVLIERLAERAPHWAQRLGAILGQGGDPRRAAVVYEELVERFPESALNVARLGIAYHQSGRATEALEMARRATELDPAAETTVALRQLVGLGPSDP